ncbi:MAG TPA: lipid A deacylase LpxR family protein [Candidatus Limnocylindria bacterium]|nr:lipid A deacylase LpxR family protein [Candidatus Limnocylindria bacterium]
MHNRRFFGALAWAAISILFSGAMRADNGWDRAVLVVHEENDSRLSDRHYTQGSRLSFLSRDYASENWMTAHTPSLGYEAARWKWGLEGGQEIYTPENISAHQLIRGDRPYAGWLYGAAIFQQRGTNGRGMELMETFRLDAGVVGPESQADDAQITWHHFWGFDRPNGWRHQINTEVGVQLGYDRRHRFVLGDKWSLQLLPEAGCNLGNVRTDFHAGSSLRAGYNIPNEFGLNESHGGADLGAYLFGGLYGQAVVVDIFLDGNNFRESHSVNKEPFVAEARFGIAFTSRHFELNVRHVDRSYEFHGQNERDGFTSILLIMKF